LLAQHPDIADALLECLTGLEFVQAAAVQLEASNGSLPGSPSDPVHPSAQLGDYRILREVGRGGMGVVYDAEQVSLGRRVALKVLPFAAAIDPKQRQRFQIEAQAAAQLHHPHIVPIFAVGCDQGIHYYAMQFVEGHSMAAIVRELRRSDGQLAKSGANSSWDSSMATEEATPTPGKLHRHAPRLAILDPSIRMNPSRDTNGFTAPAPHDASDSQVPTSVGAIHQDRTYCRCVARLGADAADALDHAHGLGIIHRDVKPANLLIDQNGAVWITDFGLARFHGDISLTGTGDVVGTLRYMSPEQAQARCGVVDQRTDVYALGVTLYELLTLRPAFDGRDHQELLRQIANDEPIAPRRLNPAIPRDLETIILKAMAKDASSRYATAQDMAGDLRRFLDDQPIVARRPGPLERGWRWARRHGKQVASAAAIVVVFLVITTAVSWRFYAQASRAESSSREARNLYLAHLIKNFPLHDRFAVSQVDQAARLLQASTDPTTREQAFQLFDQVVTVFQETSRLPLANSESRVIIARALGHLAYTHFFMSFYKGTQGRPDSTLLDQAQAEYRRSIELFEELLNESGGDKTTQRYLADALGLGGMGCLCRATNRPREAEQFYERAIQLRRELIRWVDARPSGAAHPRIQVTDERDDPFRLVNTTHILIDMMDQEGRTADADRLCRQLQDDFLAVAERFPMSEFRNLRTLWAEQLTKMLSPSSQPNGRRIMLLNCRLAIILDPDFAEAYNVLGWLQTRFPDDPSYQPEEAIVAARKAVELQPNNWLYLNTLGVAAFRVGDWKTAESSLQASIGINGGRAVDWFFLAMTRWHQGKRKDAREWFNQAVAWIARNKSDDELRRFHAEAAALLGLPGPESVEGTKKVEQSINPKSKNRDSSRKACSEAPG
jgi:serine/threonine protein kinase